MKFTTIIICQVQDYVKIIIAHEGHPQPHLRQGAPRLLIFSYVATDQLLESMITHFIVISLWYQHRSRDSFLPYAGFFLQRNVARSGDKLGHSWYSDL